jgi:glycosyltransferase involved in cell wall biosynthesis
LHLISTPERRGAEQVAWNLAAALDARDVASTVVAWSAGRAGVADLPVEALGDSTRDLRSLARLVRMARDHDVVVAHGGTTLWPGVLAARLARRPSIYRNIGDPSHWGSSRSRRLRIATAMRRADAIVALYPGAAAWMSSNYRIERDRMTVVGNGVDAHRFAMATPGERMYARRALGVPERAPVIGFVGALSPEKRPDVAVAVAARLPTVHLVVAGDGPLRAELAEEARALSGRVHLLGAVADPRPVYVAADAVLVPSDTEGVPGALLEALLCGTRVVASPVGGIPDVMSPVRGELSVNLPEPFTAAVDRVLTEGRRLDRLERSAVERSFSIDAIADEWGDVITRAATTPS